MPVDLLGDGGKLMIHPLASAGLKLSVVIVFFDSAANRMNHVVLNPGRKSMKSLCRKRLPAY